MKYKDCEIVKDLLPLYIDGVVHKNTKEYIEDHLKSCPYCEEERRLLEKPIQIPKEEERLLKNFKKSFRHKKIVISLMSILVTIGIGFALFYYVFHWESPIPYDKNLIKIEKKEDSLVSHFYGKAFYSISATQPITINVNGQKKNIVFIYYTKTLMDKPSSRLLKKDRAQEEFLFTLPLKEGKEIDEVCYIEFSSPKSIKDKNYWIQRYQSGEIIWRKIEE
ncbi:MAG: zf-HC2 domain-containing protein [Tissierellia bacterium]|nr:zf-HC2 domain-containing protein [Tissierellia bacterium]